MYGPLDPACPALVVGESGALHTPTTPPLAEWNLVVKAIACVSVSRDSKMDV